MGGGGGDGGGCCALWVRALAVATLCFVGHQLTPAPGPSVRHAEANPPLCHRSLHLGAQAHPTTCSRRATLCMLHGRCSTTTCSPPPPRSSATSCPTSSGTPSAARPPDCELDRRGCGDWAGDCFRWPCASWPGRTTVTVLCGLPLGHRRPARGSSAPLEPCNRAHARISRMSWRRWQVTEQVVQGKLRLLGS